MNNKQTRPELEENVKTLNISKKLFVALPLGFLIVLGLIACTPVEIGAVELEPVKVGIEPTPMPKNLTYANQEYGFRFEYPETWTISEEEHTVVLTQGTLTLRINYAWNTEDVGPGIFGRTGVGAGDFIYGGKVFFMNQVIPAQVLEFERKDKAVFYSEGGGLIEAGDLVFSIVLEDLESDYIGELDIPKESQEEAKTILESFERIDPTGSPPEDVESVQEETSPKLVMTEPPYEGLVDE